MRDGEVAGEGRVDGGEIGATEGLATALGEIAAADSDGAGGGLEDTEDHVDGGGFSGAVGAEEAEDFVGTDLEGEAVDGGGWAVLFAEIGDGEDGHQGRGDRLRVTGYRGRVTGNSVQGTGTTPPWRAKSDAHQNGAPGDSQSEWGPRSSTPRCARRSE